MKKYIAPIIMLAIFEAVAVTLWLTKDNFFYFINFTYIGCSIALGMFLYVWLLKAAGHRSTAMRVLNITHPVKPDSHAC